MWTKGFPKEAGRWWFYGWVSAYDKERREPELHFVEVFKTANGFWMHITGGVCLDKSEDPQGLWQKMVLPDLPSLGEVEG